MDPDTCFAVGREHVPKLRSVMRITSVFAKDALRHAVRDQLYFAGVVGSEWGKKKERRWGTHGGRYDIEATKRRRSVGVRLVHKAKMV